VTAGPVDPEALADYASRLSMVSAVERVDSSAGSFAEGVVVGDGGSVAGLSADAGERLVVVTAADARSSTAQTLVGDVRDVRAPGVDALVGGETATLVDSLGAIGGRLPLAAGLVAVTTFVVLFLFTGSVVQPLRALLSNVLTLGATLGLMVLIFQEGFGSSLLEFTPTALDTSMLVLMFCLVFGLSMDYEMFVMSRIKEKYDAGESIEQATRHGLAHTGRIVTTAAALIAVSFFAFVTSQVSFIQMFGLGAGLAILIDATLVRGVLLPASIRVLGPASWYAPAGLRRLHARVGLAEA
jgi:RND superfamily putative drug exporter